MFLQIYLRFCLYTMVFFGNRIEINFLRCETVEDPKKTVKIYARILATGILKAFNQFNFSETSKDPGVAKVFLQCPLDRFPIQPSKD